MQKIKNVEQLKGLANSIRQSIIRMTCAAGSGHPGGSLSAAEILTTLFFNEMKHDPKSPKWEARDRFILSKGHACPVLYAALAEAGYFSKNELKTLRKLGSRLQGHPSRRRLPMLEASTGSLGQGLSIALGMALGLRLDNSQSRVYCLMGDGEIEEGQIWEAAMAAAHHKADNLCGIIDYNGLQIDGANKDVMNSEPLKEKWEAFGWEVQLVNGHSVEALLKAFKKARKVKGRPSLILAKTVKGKGVSFMENKAGWHGRAPSREEEREALKELCGR